MKPVDQHKLQSLVEPVVTGQGYELVDVEFKNGKFEEIEGTEREIPAELVLLAMGFVGPEKEGLVEQLGVDLDDRGKVARDNGYQSSV